MLTREALTSAVRKAKTDKTPVDVGAGAIRIGVDRVREAKVSDDDVAKVKAQLGDAAAAGRLVPFIISTERRATDGHVIKASAWQLDRYRKNPVVLHGHSRWSPRIADSIVELDGNRLRAVAAFFPRELSALSWELGEIAALRGHAASVGFRILRAMPAPDDVTENIPWALDIEACRLDEWSLVTIGADEDAMVEDARSEGLSTEAIAAACARMMDEGGLAALVRAEVERLYRAALPTPPPVISVPTITPGMAKAIAALDASHAAARQLLQG
jgi:hypothetical protein